MIKKILLIIGALLIGLNVLAENTVIGTGVTLSSSGLKSSDYDSDNVSVKVRLEEYADVETLNTNEWLNTEENEKELLHMFDELAEVNSFWDYMYNNSLFRQMLENNSEEIAMMGMYMREKNGNTSVSSTFSGQGDEARFSVIPVTFSANTGCVVKVEATAFKDATGNIEQDFQGTYMVAISELNRYRTDITPLVLEQNQSSTDLSGAISLRPDISSNGNREYAIVTAVQMPEDFWNVRAGEYKSTVTLTVADYN